MCAIGSPAGKQIALPRGGFPERRTNAVVFPDTSERSFTANAGRRSLVILRYIKTSVRRDPPVRRSTKTRRERAWIFDYH